MWLLLVDAALRVVVVVEKGVDVESCSVEVDHTTKTLGCCCGFCCGGGGLTGVDDLRHHKNVRLLLWFLIFVVVVELGWTIDDGALRVAVSRRCFGCCCCCWETLLLRLFLKWSGRLK